MVNHYCTVIGFIGVFLLGKYIGDWKTNDSLRGGHAAMADLFGLRNTNINLDDVQTKEQRLDEWVVDDQNNRDDNQGLLSPEELILKHFQSHSCAMSETKPVGWLKQMFILIGVQKGGTKAVHTFLEEHPQFVSRCRNESMTMEQNFFNYEVQPHHDTIPQAKYQQAYADHLQAKCPLAVETLKDDPKAMYLDDSPLYLQDSDSIPPIMACVTPWAKTVAILRNPTDRAFSHYNFYTDRDWCTEHTFEEYVDINIQELEEAGVTKATNIWEEFQAWQRYNEKFRNQRKCNTFVTRGLYAIQILHYMKALEAAGRDGDLMAIHSEDLKGDNRQSTYDSLLKLLDLEPHTLEHSASVHKTTYESAMDASVQRKLNAFFKPYNERLYDLLDWDPVW